MQLINFTFDKELANNFAKKDLVKVKVFLTKLINKKNSLRLEFKDITEKDYIQTSLFTTEEIEKIYCPFFVFLDDTRDILGRRNNKYKEHIDTLIKLGLLEYQVDSDGNRISNIYNKEINSFKLKPKFIDGVKKTKTKLTNKQMIKIMETIYKNKIEKFSPVLKHIYNEIKDFNFDLLDLNTTKFRRIMKSKYPLYKMKKINNNKTYKTQENYIEDHIKTTYEYLKRWNKSNELERVDFFTVDKDKFGHRSYYILTTIPSELRRFLIKDMIPVDITNSQPYFASVELLEQTGNKNIDFIKSVESGHFYEDLYEKSETLKELTSDKKQGRSLAKISFCRDAFGRTTDNLIQSFPEGGKIIDEWKKEFIPKKELDLDKQQLKNYNRSKNVVLKLQRKESKDMNLICQKMIEQNLFFYLVHDCCYVAKRHIEQAKIIFDDVLSKNGVKYNLNIG